MRQAEQETSQRATTRRFRLRRGPVRRRVSLRRRFAGTAALAVLAVVLGGYHWFSAAGRVRAEAERVLTRMTGGEVRVGAASFSLFHGLDLSDVSVSTPDDRDAEHCLFRAGHLHLDFDLLALLTGRVRVAEIVATDPQVNIVTDQATGKANWQRLSPSRRERRRTDDQTIIRLRRAMIRVFARDGEATHMRGEIGLDVVAAPQHGRPGVYDITWKTRSREHEAGRVRFDRKRATLHTIEGGLPSLAIDAVATAAALPPAFRRWLDVLGLEGTLRPVRVAIDRQNESRIEIELADVRMSIPLDKDEAALRPAERFLRLTDVTGRLVLSDAAVEVALDGHLLLPANETTADARPPFHIEGRIGGDFAEADSITDLGFDIQASVQTVPLPAWGPTAPDASRKFVERWGSVHRFLQAYDPHGIVDVAAKVSKPPGPDERFHIDELAFTPRGVDAMYHRFPYRVTGLTGNVTFRSDGVFLRALTGKHGAGRVQVDGWLSRPGAHSAVELEIRGGEIPLDEDLRVALPSRHKEFWALYHPAGKADFHVRMSRPEGSAETGSARWTTRIDMDFLGGRAQYERFRYPLENLTGRVTITNTYVRLEKIRARREGGSIAIEGQGTHSGPDAGRLVLDIDAENLPIDDALLGALPDPMRRGLMSLRLAGRTDVKGRLSRKAPDPLTYDLIANFHDARLNPEMFPFPLRNLDAEVHLTEPKIEIRRLTGHHDDSTITVQGTVTQAPAGSRIELTIRSDALTLSDALHDALPTDVQATWDSLAPQGRVRIGIELTKPAGADDFLHRTVVEPLGVRLRYAPLPILITDVTGRVVSIPGQTELHDVRGRHDTATLELNGRLWREGDADVGKLALTVTGMPFNEALRQAVPWRMRRTWNDITPAGRFDLELSDLSFTSPTEGPTDWSFAGTARLHDARFALGFTLDGINGEITGQGHARGGGEAFAVDTWLRLDRGTFDGHQLEDVTGHLVHQPARNRLEIDELAGRLYGGQCRGLVEIDFGRQTRYGLSLTVQNMDLAAFLDARRKPAQKPTQAKGRVNAKLYVGGRVGHGAGRRGKGEVHISDAQFFKLPFMLSILHVINFTAPDENAFHDAHFDFHIDGENIEFDDITLRGNALSLIGRGRAHTPTSQLDLTLVAGSPHNLPRLPILSELAEGAAGELMDVRIHGSLDKPEITARPLRSIDAALRMLFQPQRNRSPSNRRGPPR